MVRNNAVSLTEYKAVNLVAGYWQQVICPRKFKDTMQGFLLVQMLSV